MPQLTFLRRVFSRRTYLYFLSISTFLCCAVFSFLAYIVLFHHVLPMRRAYWLETDYQRAMRDANQQEKVASRLAVGSRPRRRIQPLIHDVPPLHAWNAGHTRVYSEWLGLNRDGTGSFVRKGPEYWIYLGGTAREKSREEEQDPTVFTHRYRKPTCADPPYICDMYNTAFNRISERWHNAFGYQTMAFGTTKPLLRYADCDISPQFCSSRHWGLGSTPVLLVHLKVSDPCDFSMNMRGRCTGTWRFIALPMLKAPWTRQIRISLDKGGSTVVPAFPNAEEQMWSLMAQSGALDGLQYMKHSNDSFSRNSIVTVEPVENDKPRVSTPFGLVSWAVFRDFVDNPLKYPEWLKEAVIKCYVERWADIFTRWWDGVEDVVRPRSCEGVEEERARAKDAREAFIQSEMRRRDQLEARMKARDRAVADDGSMGRRGAEFLK
ncbi:hypothetical protein BU26DRAFT_519987 [Trematosphaeria pertusa]|uniref:Uncharacterized protein n=1 Tax=Trematosphaeria pertusa TaxID=390896 RepID=A0A6A6ICG0_9PLEO|nr:uncharacterized protein BU26DRAFT_519987 [Trematosphaeria pertusa]KAF2248264.1 hypothetical protein BU26DRAFT_519987 [Trematosphaeria pertusa]